MPKAAMMALAPLLGGALAALLVRVVAPLAQLRNAGRGLRRVHAGAFSLMSLAYGANDAQKMLAVLAVAVGVTSATVPVVWWHLLAVAAVFGLGAAIGMAAWPRRSARGSCPSAPSTS